MLLRFSIVCILVASAAAQATFNNVAFELRNYEAYITDDLNFRCAFNVYRRGINGCTTLINQATDTYIIGQATDWKLACSRVANTWNRDPTNTLPVNTFTKILAPDELSYGCRFRYCADDSEYELLTGADDGRRTAMIPPTYYCGRPPAGMVRPYGGSTLANSVTNNPSSNAALLELSVVSLHPTRYHNTVTTWCALRADQTVVCWGKNLYAAAGLDSVVKIAATRDAHAFLRSDGTIQLRGTTAVGASFTSPTSTGNFNSATLAASGLVSDIECNINGACVGLLSNGKAFFWGEAGSTPILAVAQAMQADDADFVAVYSSFQAFLLVRRNGTGLSFGSNTYGGGTSTAAPDLDLNTVNISKVVSNQNGFGILTTDGRACSWGGPANQMRSTSIASTIGVPGAVKDIKAGSYISVQFLLADDTLYSVGNPSIVSSPIIGVAAFLPGFSLHQSNVALKSASDGIVRAYASNGVVAATLNDGKNYVDCVGASAAIVCRADDGTVARLVGVAGSYAIPSGTSGVTDLAVSNTAIAAFSASQGAVYTIGSSTQPSAGQVANELTADVDQVYGAYATFAVIRGLGVEETPFPTASPTSSPTLSPSTSPTRSPTLSPSTSPTLSPSLFPTRSPTNVGDTSSPTMSPTHFPSTSPSMSPTMSPSAFPTSSPSLFPSASPSFSPSASPSASPSNMPTGSPSFSPSASPSTSPSFSPTSFPTFETELPFPTDPDCNGLRTAAVENGVAGLNYLTALTILPFAKQRSCAREIFGHELARTSPTQPVANWGVRARAVFANGIVQDPTETALQLGSRARILQYTIPEGASTFVAQCICDGAGESSCSTKMYFTQDDIFGLFSAFRPYNNFEVVQCVNNQVTLQVALLPASTRRQLQGGGSTPSGSNGPNETPAPTSQPTRQPTSTSAPTPDNGNRQCGCAAPTPSV